jgi:hypothetical protein
LFKTGLKAVDVPDLGFNEVPIFSDWNQDSQLDLLIISIAEKNTAGIIMPICEFSK